MGASGWGEKGKKVSGDTGRGYEQEVSREPPSPAPLQATAQSRAEDKEEMTDWGGVGVGEERGPFLGDLCARDKLGRARIPAFNFNSNQEMFLSGNLLQAKHRVE